MKKTIGCFLLTFILLIFVTGPVLAEEDSLPSPPAGPVPSVKATESKPAPVPAAPFSADNDEPSSLPAHPPINQIPPVYMPYPQEGEAAAKPLSAEASAAITYNTATGEETILPVEAGRNAVGLVQGGGYCPDCAGEAADGHAVPESMTCMSLISNTAIAPWRMNVKLVIENDGYFGVCSGTMLDAETVLTAGHCVYDRTYGWGWAENIWVYPGWDGDANQWAPPPTVINPYGFGHSSNFTSLTGWVSSGDYNYDLGVFAIDRAVGMLTGWYSWAYGGDCAWHTATNYNSATYPAENCNGTLFNGGDMYYWDGPFDSCPTWNQLQLLTPSDGCLCAIWGGQSGGGAYYIDNGNRFVHAVTSRSNRSTQAYYVRQTESWITYLTGTFIPNTSRGSSFDLQPLDVNAEPATITAGQFTTLLNHRAVNPTNGAKNATHYFDVYLSANDNISTADTFLSRQVYTYSFAAMGQVTVNMPAVKIPSSTPTGDYWLGVIYDNATDGVSANNDTDGWDAATIHVNCVNPTAPDTLAASAFSSTQIDLTWNDTADNDLGFKIERAEDAGGSPGAFSQINTTGANIEAYSDTGLLPGATYYYRVRAYNGCGNSGYSNIASAEANVPGSISILSPNGGESWQRNALRVIRWNASAGLGNLRISLWQNTTQIGIIADDVNPADGSYVWSVGAYSGGVAPLGTGYTIRIREKGTDVSDASDATFSIVKISVKTPNGGESWQIGSTQNITWVAKSISGNLRIVLFKDGVKVGNIVNSIDPALGTYSWTVGNYIGGTATIGTGYQVQIREIGTDAGDRSDMTFTLTSP